MNASNSCAAPRTYQGADELARQAGEVLRWLRHIEQQIPKHQGERSKKPFFYAEAAADQLGLRPSHMRALLYELCTQGHVDRRSGIRGPVFMLLAENAPIRPSKNKKRNQRWSHRVRARDGACVECGEDNFELLHAHHVVPRAQAPELQYDLSNGVTLCGPCHRRHHHG